MEKFRISIFGNRAQALIKWVVRLVFIAAVLAALVLMGLLVRSTGNSSRLAQQYDLLLLLNGVLALALFLWVSMLTFRLIRQLRSRQFGARLTSRFALAFAVMAIIPGVVIYLLSVQFMSRSVESWFNVRVDSALQSGLTLGQASLDSQVGDLLSRARLMADDLSTVPDQELSVALTRLRENTTVGDALVFTVSGSRVVGFSSSSFGSLLPQMPPVSVLNQLRLSRSYARTEAVEGTDFENPQLRIRVIVPVFSNSFKLDAPLGASPEPYLLQLTRLVPENIGSNLNEVQKGFRDYQELALSRQGIQKLYGITLTLALLVTLFTSIAVALAIARRLVKPLLTLASGTQAVAVGDYRPLPEPTAMDEIGLLTRSFNAMTRQLDEARRQVESNRIQLERSNAYLESVMAGLSSGVIVFDERFNVTTVNKGAQSILDVDLRSVPGRPLEVIDSLIEFTRQIRKAFADHAAVGSERHYWQEQITLSTSSESDETDDVTLLMRGTRLRIDGRPTGYVVVFDDISEVISANRARAWGEVARRLAHEIKNPLTPIQLSAERLAMKLEGHLDERNAGILARSTNTIINQVSSLKKMVDDFREYARTPPAQMQHVDINALIADLAILYGWDPEGNGHHDEPLYRHIRLDLAPDLPLAEADPTQLRQVLNNLLSNSRDAMADLALEGDEPGITIRTTLTRPEKDQSTDGQAIRITLEDRGGGFSAKVLQTAFEPYVTTKAHGTGLGLPIVRKIIEEHGGRIDIANRKDGGARVSILLTRLTPKTGN